MTKKHLSLVDNFNFLRFSTKFAYVNSFIVSFFYAFSCYIFMSYIDGYFDDILTVMASGIILFAFSFLLYVLTNFMAFSRLDDNDCEFSNIYILFNSNYGNVNLLLITLIGIIAFILFSFNGAVYHVAFERIFSIMHYSFLIYFYYLFDRYNKIAVFNKL